MDGTVLDAMGGGQYKVEVFPSESEGATPADGERETTQVVRAKLAGKLKKHHIRVLPGDDVIVAVSPYDLSHGLIVYRGKKKPRQPRQH